MAGKGDGRRAGADDKAYSEGWDRIFGQKESPAIKAARDAYPEAYENFKRQEVELVPVWTEDFEEIEDVE